HRPHNWILILDYGSQYSQLIARRIRELNIYCEIHPFNKELTAFESRPPQGIILSGSPRSVNNQKAPSINTEMFDTGVPILAICYGMEALVHENHSIPIEDRDNRTFGEAKIQLEGDSRLFDGLPYSSSVWTDESYSLSNIPDPYEALAYFEEGEIAAIGHQSESIYGLQFHPETGRSEYGKQILRNFATSICGLRMNWTTENFIRSTIQEIRTQVGDRKVICGLSGGVDSTVVATLVHQAIGDQLQCIFVNNGLLRKNEYANVLELYKSRLNLPVKGIEASSRFLEALEGITDPEQKRKIIGNSFIEVFDDTVNNDPEVKYLAQGTVYPDVIESVSFDDSSPTIKSHHNVGGLPDKMNLELIEPLRELFKDEVRAVGRKLEIPENFIGRHPFPGPGLGIRIISDITEDKINLLREADDIFISELRENNLYDNIWQA